MLDSLPLFALLAFVILQLAAAGYDLLTLTIPNPIVYGLAAGFAMVGALSFGEIAWSSHLAAGAIVFALGAALFYLKLFGGGDAKLCAVSALWVGLGELPLYLLLVAVIGLLLALVLRVLQPVAPLVLARLPDAVAGGLPPSLYPGGGVPYGIAIAGGAILIALW